MASEAIGVTADRKKVAILNASAARRSGEAAILALSSPADWSAIGDALRPCAERVPQGLIAGGLFMRRPRIAMTRLCQTLPYLPPHLAWHIALALRRRARSSDRISDGAADPDRRPYPPRNAIEILPRGERFVVEYIPGYEHNIAIMRDESPYGRRLLLAEALAPVERAAAQVPPVPIIPISAANIVRQSKNFWLAMAKSPRRSGPGITRLS